MVLDAGDERPGAPGDVRRLARHRAGLARSMRVAPGRRPPTSSARSARPATRSRGAALLPPLAPNARVAILDAGAYGAVMSSTYNARPAGGRGAGGRRTLGRRSATGSRYEALWAGERMPDWLARRVASRLTPEGGQPSALLRRLRGRRALARLAILFERLWPRALAAARRRRAVLCAGAARPAARCCRPGPHARCCSRRLRRSLGLAGPRPARARACRTTAAADRRLELASGLRHRPLSVLTDRPAGWPIRQRWRSGRRIRARARAQIRRLRVGLPRPGLARRDRRALRGGLWSALAAAWRSPAPMRPRAAGAAPSTPDPSAGRPAPGDELQAWITPPAYTGLAPCSSSRKAAPVSVPAGSHLTVSVTGGEGEPDPGAGRPRRAVPGARRRELPGRARPRAGGGRLAVRRDGRELGGLGSLTVVADQPPTVAWTEPPGPAPRGLQTRLPWQATDDYGVAALQAELRLRDAAGRAAAGGHHSAAAAAARRRPRAPASRTSPRIPGPGCR